MAARAAADIAPQAFSTSLSSNAGARWIGRIGALALAAGLAACAGPQAGGAAGANAAGPPSVLSRDGAAPLVQAGVAAAGSRGALAPGGVATVALLAPTSAAQPAVARIGQSLAEAAQLAQRDIGDPGLQLRVYDTGGDPTQAAAAASQAVAEGATVIIGPLFAQSVRATAPIAAAGDLSVLAFSTDPTVAGGNTYLLSFLTANEIDRVVGYAATQGAQRLGAVAPQSALGSVSLSALGQAAARHGGEVVAVSRYEQTFLGIEQGVRSYADAHNAEEAFAPVDGVMIADQGQALQSVAAYLAFFDVSPQETRFFGPGTWNDASTSTELALRGGWFAGPDPRLSAAFERRFEAAYGKPPHRLASLAYDGMAAAGALVSEARARGETFPFTAAAITDPAGFAGANGVFRLTPDGLNERGLAVMEVQADGFSVIDPAPSSFAGF